jgi:2-dehydro-3-deoxy-D-arabinonate dehydratase
VKLYRTKTGPILEDGGRFRLLDGEGWNALFSRDDLSGHLSSLAARLPPLGDVFRLRDEDLLPPIEDQEVWAAGVTYYRSRDARMEEAKSSGGGSFYDRVYTADRPELFFKASPHRVAGPGEQVRIRKDSKWNVPEPELALWVSSAGTIEGFTIGNDMSSRDIEGENPLYLPQAKVYDGCCALGPAILVADGPLPKTTIIALQITRGGSIVFEGATSLERLKRTPEELVSWLMRDQSFLDGCFLLTGTGIVPGNDFTLLSGDQVAIEIDGIGRLVNPVA